MKVSPAQRGLRLDSSASMSPFTPPRQSHWSSCPITLRRSGRLDRLDRLDPGDSLAGKQWNRQPFGGIPWSSMWVALD